MYVHLHIKLSTYKRFNIYERVYICTQCSNTGFYKITYCYFCFMVIKHLFDNRTVCSSTVRPYKLCTHIFNLLSHSLKQVSAVNCCSAPFTLRHPLHLPCAGTPYSILIGECYFFHVSINNIVLSIICFVCQHLQER